MNDKMPTIQFKKFNHDYLVVLTYDKCKSGANQYGPWNLYGVEYQGAQQGIFAEDALHQELRKYTKGAGLVIRRNHDQNDQVEWQVMPTDDNAQRQPKHSLDDRTADIHRQVALKIATISIGQSLKPWTNEDHLEIKIRMDKLLEILDGSTEDDLSS
jgi:hypothetical protein